MSEQSTPAGPRPSNSGSMSFGTALNYLDTPAHNTRSRRNQGGKRMRHKMRSDKMRSYKRHSHKRHSHKRRSHKRRN
jgi:hypothetical protein